MNKKWIIIGSVSLAVLAGGAYAFYKGYPQNLYSSILKKAWDLKSEEEIKTLHPKIRPVARAFLKEAEKEGIYLRVTSGLRTFEEQDELYAKGRTAPGNIVTNAKAGESKHNYGLAFDVVEIKDGKALWNNPNWSKIGELGKKRGFTWGGDFKSIKDKPHFEKTFGLSNSELLAKYNKTNNKYITV